MKPVGCLQDEKSAAIVVPSRLISSDFVTKKEPVEQLPAVTEQNSGERYIAPLNGNGHGVQGRIQKASDRLNSLPNEVALHVHATISCEPSEHASIVDQCVEPKQDTPEDNSGQPNRLNDRYSDDEALKFESGFFMNRRARRLTHAAVHDVPDRVADEVPHETSPANDFQSVVSRDPQHQLAVLETSDDITFTPSMVSDIALFHVTVPHPATMKENDGKDELVPVLKPPGKYDIPRDIFDVVDLDWHEKNELKRAKGSGLVDNEGLTQLGAIAVVGPGISTTDNIEPPGANANARDNAITIGDAAEQNELISLLSDTVPVSAVVVNPDVDNEAAIAQIVRQVMESQAVATAVEVVVPDAEENIEREQKPRKGIGKKIGKVISRILCRNHSKK